MFFISNAEREEVLRQFMSPETTPRRYGGSYPDDDVGLCERREFVYQPIRLKDGGGDDGSSDSEDEVFHEVLHPRHFGLKPV